MMTPFAVDANAIHAFQQERIKKERGEAHAAIEAITAGHCVALDSEKLCYQEWLDCAGGRFPFALADWVADQAATGRVRFFPLGANTCRKPLLQNGLPQKDHKWVRLAIGCGGNRIVSGDIDFFDPSKKQAPEAQKCAIRAARRGPFAKFLERTFGVRVMCLEHVEEEIDALKYGP